MTSVELVEGERLEQKIERIMENKEAIKDGAPLIYTDRKEGILAGYNIRTDRWEVAAEAMDLVHKNTVAKREGKAEMMVSKKADDGDKKDGGAESVQGTEKSG